MLSKQIQELAKAKALIAKLETEISQALPSELAALPAIYGFKSAKDFLKAFKAAVASGASKKAKKAGKKASAKAAAPSKAKGRKRARITDEIKAQVKTLAQEGKSGAAIAKALGISLPSVQNIKKAAGLVKARVEAPAHAVSAPTAPSVS